jgi:hypothetical protein
LPLSLILPGLAVIRLARIRVDGNIERMSFSYVLSLAIMFIVLYLGGLMGAFDAASWVLLIIMVVSFFYLIALFRNKTPHLSSFFSQIRRKLNVIIPIIGLLATYIVFLSLEAIYDSDVIQWYLPVAREIVNLNRLTYNSGYDYVINLRPIGVSVLYAWIYVISGSTLSEAFRLMPLVPILTLIALNYQISVLVTKSQIAGIVSTVIFLVLPLNDYLIFYTAFYPDTFYYPLIFMTIYLLLKYLRTRRESLLFWIGLSLGAAGLLKAQAIYIIITVFLVLVISKQKHRKLSLMLCCLTPFYILVPEILAHSVQPGGIFLTIPSLTSTQWGLFFFLISLSGICYLILTRNTNLRSNSDPNAIRSLVKKVVLILVPIAVLSCLWYVNNFLTFGTFIYTTSMNLPNLDWALSILNPIRVTPQEPNMWYYIAYFMFAFVHPALLGYVMLVPLLIGLFFVLRERLQDFRILFLFEMIFMSMIFSIVVISLYTSMPGYNPRDIFPLVPLLTSLSAIGIISVVGELGKKSNTKGILASFILIAYFGMLNYVHSVSLWWTQIHYKTVIGWLMSAFANIAGLNLYQTSFHIEYGSQAASVGQTWLQVSLLSFIAGIPLILIMICRRYSLATKLRTRLKRSAPSPPVNICSPRRRTLVKNVLVVSLILCVIVLPRTEMLVAQGGLQDLKENQISVYYRSAYGLVGMKLEGDVLIINGPAGLVYYSPDTRIIELLFPGNLAHLRECFQSVAPNESVTKLKQYGIRYLLLMPFDPATRRLDASLNFTLSKIIHDPELATLLGRFGPFSLYDLGV